MKVDPRTQRVYRARKKGLTIRQIAVKEGVSPSTIYELCSGPRFKANLIRIREAEAIRCLNNASKLNALVEVRLNQISTDTELGLKKAMPGMRELKDTVHAAATLTEMGEARLAKQFREAEQADHPGVRAARQQLEQKRKERMVKMGTIEVAVTPTNGEGNSPLGQAGDPDVGQAVGLHDEAE